jgi:hypothetical protein
MATKKRKDGGAMIPEANPDFLHYGGPYPADSLRPNPHTAQAARGDLAFAQGTSMTGDFGDGDAYDAAGGSAVRPARGLPKPGDAAPKGKPDSTAHGWP